MSRPPRRNPPTTRSIAFAIASRSRRTATATVSASAFRRSKISSDDATSIAVVRGFRRSVRRGSRNSGVAMWLVGGGRLNFPATPPGVNEEVMNHSQRPPFAVIGCHVLLLAACHAGPPGPTSVGEYLPAEWPLFAKVRPVAGAKAMVVSGSPIASQVGVDVLQRGGNAVDAAVAVGFALTVVHPEAGNIGGGGFMVIRFADGRVRTIDYREAAPERATRNMYLDSSGNPTEKSVTGHLASGVPGSVAGMAEAQKRYGTLPWPQLIEPAV